MAKSRTSFPTPLTILHSIKQWCNKNSEQQLVKATVWKHVLLKIPSSESSAFNYVNMSICCFFICYKTFHKQNKQKAPCQSISTQAIQCGSNSLKKKKKIDIKSLYIKQMSETNPVILLGGAAVKWGVSEEETWCSYLSAFCKQSWTFFQNNSRDVFCFLLQSCKRRNGGPRMCYPRIWKSECD